MLGYIKKQTKDIAVFFFFAFCCYCYFVFCLDQYVRGMPLFWPHEEVYMVRD